MYIINNSQSIFEPKNEISCVIGDIKRNYVKMSMELFVELQKIICFSLNAIPKKFQKSLD